MKIRSFKGLTPAKGKAEAIASLPYDVVNFEQAEEQEKRIHTDMEQTVKQAGYPDVQSFAKTYQKSERLVREYNEELRAWEKQTEQKKEQSSEPPKKASIREKLHRYQQKNRQQQKQIAKKKSKDRER